MAHSGIEILWTGHNLVRLLVGLWTSVWIAGVSLILGLLVGLLFGLARTGKARLVNGILWLYLQFFRIVPTVVLLFLVYYILPRQFNLNWPASWMAVLAFTLWVAAEFSDVVRGALTSVPKHQIEAGQALGLSQGQLFWYVKLPQAWRLALPATVNLATRVIKTTSLLLMISVMDVINIGQQIIEANNQTHPNGVFWVYGFIMLLYFIVDYPLTRWSHRLAQTRR
ncbi:amino acid ABC transporter permease [Limosilactobacillus equigenerosi]|uniref:ABC superfamily ATP binding cassette transporter, membrane protein n=1 Tax=Limosilactobacillus equigenerosi DSM 18793 = JCM 14505 TaxID=1423742 RepID=A0A0R1V3B1_9LACO|nr:amino acid ABC transporter permease [Limosilactobacillus equigenerosi]KRL96331.1 ABC superfamily ATP binding cassette transporter, membrane protein [Limosilactobacillus equigenerosi DSM 18793 = JCM 14505]